MESTDVYGLVHRERIAHLQQMLERQGLQGDHIAILPVAPGRYALHDEVLHRDAASARRGLAFGVVIGLLLGVAAALVVPAISGADRIVAAIAAFAGFGGLVGAMWGLQAAETNDSDPIQYREVGPDDDMSLVAVHHEHWHNRAHRILERHGAEFLQAPTPV